VEFACSPRGRVASPWVLWLSPKDMQFSLIGGSKLPVGVNECDWLVVCMRPVRNWRPVTQRQLGPAPATPATLKSLDNGMNDANHHYFHLLVYVIILSRLFKRNLCQSAGG